MGAEMGFAVDEAPFQKAVFAQKTIDANSLLVPSLVLEHEAGERQQGQTKATGPEVAEVARRLGIDMVFDSDLLYIAEDLLKATLPDDWELHRDANSKAYYHNIMTSLTQWAHPLEMYYRGLVFMRKEGDQLLEEKAKANPPTPQETREMAKYFGINPREEIYLMPIAKAAVNAPIPPEWEEFEDDDGEVYFINKITKKTNEHHPLDGYFFELVNQKRVELLGMEIPVYPMKEYALLDHSFVPYPWLEFVDVKGRGAGLAFFYNFRDNLTTYEHPCELIKDVLRTEAALRLQAWFRGQQVREANRALVEQLAATSIQKIFRGHVFRQEKKRLKDKQENAATLIIQRCWRGSHQRNTNVILKRQRAATVIQSIYRTRLVHKTIKRVNKLSGAALPIGLALQAEALKKASVSVPMHEYTDLLTTIAAVHAKLTEKLEPELEFFESGDGKKGDGKGRKKKKDEDYSETGSTVSGVSKKKTGKKSGKPPKPKAKDPA
mmetsp:Transcript_28420/g.47719  ORF Transcript_28420/g.47719 Transcript_28420/m.47719 type:complete len:493 (+) Transcript_28420:564-2042(+)|eukprot:CAMPEP_0198206134 /NCGR_PEP_ID=MMETSP1445-20131203/9663_1 /TAXON_ID=36898 /ORGANISM="Pyramimonas sp., Strain CCMP2087" /LENGTH=492 /DNA_ID=CAMNT_0043878699 /DNA_START=472 /DNA_END=1950 /DNA_ORIENTATION=+